MQEVRTFGQFVEQDGLLADLGKAITQINARATKGAKRVSRVQKLPPVQCFKCTAKKACCNSVVVARLYEGVVVAGFLKRAGRDTPELRAQLDAAATAMEAADPYQWRVPCVFLDGRERCTVYEARPTPCGSLYVYTPPANCNDPTASVQAFVAHAENRSAIEIEEQFRVRLSLRLKVGRRYIGVLPRMVLVALELWDRTDFRDVLRERAWPSEAEAARWNRRT